MAATLTLVVEDGTGRSDANSFCSIDEANDILSENIHETAWFDAEHVFPSDQDACLIRATRLLVDDVAARGWRWIGYPINSTQRLPMPRSGLWSREGFPLASDAVPAEIKALQAQLAAMLVADDVAAAADDGVEQSLTMGRLSVTYARTSTRRSVVPDRLYDGCLHLFDRVLRVIRA